MNPALPDNDSEGVADFPAPFGHYLLLHPLARGGMGNVFLAKTGGMMGIEKHCVVKTLRSRFTGDPEYVQRFVDEARVVVQLSHRNICPVFDVGRVSNSYYLAMELVIGRDVRTVHTELIQHGRHLPEASTLHIVCEMLDALDYAHRHADPVSGEPLRLVHRDVSPQNVMINVEGEVKLIDFGLAEKGSIEPANSHPTSQATVMGKISYMAPEHARGDPVDARADQFSAAVVAYELLTEDRYYEGMSNQEVWMTAGTGTFRAAGLAKLDPTLRSILEKALSPDKADRYPSCGEFREAILGYARMNDLHAGARNLREIMGELFADDLRGTRELLQKFAHVSSQARPGFSGPTGPAGPPVSDAVFSIATSVHAKQIHDPTEIFPTSGLFELPTPAQKPKWPLAAALLGIAGLVALGVALAVTLVGPEEQVKVVTIEQPAPLPLPAPPPPAPVVVPPPVAPEPVVAKDPPHRRRTPPAVKKLDLDKLSALEKIDRVKAQCPTMKCAQSIDKKEWVELRIAASTDKSKERPRDAYAARINQCAARCLK